MVILTVSAIVESADHARERGDEDAQSNAEPSVRQYAPINAPFRAPRRRVADLVAKSRAALLKRSQASEPESVRDSVSDLH